MGKTGTKIDKMETQAATPEVKPAADVISTASTPVGDQVPPSALVVKTAKAVKSSVTIEPSADAELKDSKVVGGVQMANPTQLGTVAGLSTASMISDSSKKPYTPGGVNRETRYGKKTGFSDFVINNTISEQIEPTFNDVPDLKSDPDSEVGYRGRVSYSAARSKKNGGSTPQNNLFERSIDFHHHGAALHTTGQVIESIANEPNADYPTVEYAENGTTDSYGVNETPDPATDYVTISTPMHKSNYLLNAMVLKFRNGKLSGISFKEDRIIASSTEGAVEEANLNWQVDSNVTINAVNKLQRSLGRDTADKWSPLGFAISQPYQYNTLFHDIEATTGATCALAKRSADKSLGFQVNMIQKDGTRAFVPYAREFLDGIVQFSDDRFYSHTVGTDFQANIIPERLSNASDFGVAALKNGNASVLIAMHDTTKKYDSKAAILNSPKSLKQFVTNVDATFGILRAKPEFIKALNTVDTFSTETGNYNPLLPIHVNDRVRLMNPLSLNRFVIGWRHPEAFDGIHTGTDSNIYAYKYSDNRTTNTWSVKHPLVEGLITWLLRNENALARVYGGDGNTEVTTTIPCNFTGVSFDLFSFMVCAAAHDIVAARAFWFRDIIWAADQSEYLWTDLDTLDSLNAFQPIQYKLGEIGEPLVMGRLLDCTRLNYEWGEMYDKYADTAGVNQRAIAMPWYLSEAAFKDSRSDMYGFKNPDCPNLVNYPITRSGVTHVALTDALKLTPKELLLSFDQITYIPVTDVSSADVATGCPCLKPNSHSSTCYVVAGDEAKVSHICGMRYDAQSDGRLMVVRTDESSYTAADVYSIPRRFGYVFPDFGDNIIRAHTTVSEGVYGYTAMASLDCAAADATNRYDFLESFKAVGSYGITGTNSQQVDRAAALQQTYYRYFASRLMILENNMFISTIGIVPAFSAAMNGSAVGGELTIDQEVAGVTFLWKCNAATAAGSDEGLDSDASRFGSFARVIWPIVQRMRFAVNPFEQSDELENTSVSVDNMEAMSYFGFTGFKAVDYEELVNRRADSVLQKNTDYLKDIFLAESAIFN